MFCLKCGAELPDGVKFCTNCGAPTAQSIPAAPPAAPAPPEQPTQGFAPAAPSYQQTQPPQTPPYPTQQYPGQNPYQMPRQGQYQVPQAPQYQQPQNQQAPQYQQPQYQQAPQYQQPQYQQPQYQQPQYQQAPQGRYQPQPPKAKKSKKGLVIGIIAALLVVALVVGGVLFLQNRGSGLEDSYASLCDMTSLGTQSYLYARVLTEQLLETDIATAEPSKIEALFRECLDAWAATGEATEQIDSMSAALSEKKGLQRLDAKNVITVIPMAFAADGDPQAAAIAKTLSAEESISRCTLLSSHLRADVQTSISAIRELQSAYHGRGTDLAAWENAVSVTAASFHTVVFLSGEVVDGDGTTTARGTRCVRTLSTAVKAGSLSLSGTDIVVDVSQNGAAIVMGPGDGVTMNLDEVQDALPGGDSTAITISTHPRSAGELPITFHSTSISGWFVIDRVGGFTISRAQKGGSEPITVPNVGGETVDPTGQTEEEIRDEFNSSGNPLPTGSRGPIGSFAPPAGPGDVRDEIQRANNPGGNSGNTATPPPTQTVDNNTLTVRRNAEGAGDGEITVSMLWGTHDDLDLHMDTPDGGHIYYSNKTAGGGTLDIDMNASSSDLRDSPIENIFFPEPANGHYKVYIRDFRDRTDGYPTHYLVRVVIAGEEHVYEGDIDATGTEIVIVEFDYLGPDDPTAGRTPLTEENMNSLLNAAGAGQGDITVSLAWNTWDDVDLHMETPDGGHIYYSNKSAGGGILDVDANAGSQRILDPVENIYFAAPSNGHYKVYIKDFSDRTDDSSTEYLVRVTIGGESQTFRGTIDGTGKVIDILEFDYGGAPEGDGLGDATFGGHSYAFYDGTMSWSDARAMCQSMGGHLVTITSAEEQAFLESQYPGTTGWIGAFGDEGGWHWITGETMDFADWKSGEPNNQGGNEWFLHLYSGMKWNDLPNDDTTYHRGFYCEWDTMVDLNEGALDEQLSSLGAMSGEITISLMWDSADDLDLHVFTPDGSEIYFANDVAGGGELDVDSNAFEDEISDSPVENIYFAEPAPGEYWVYIDNYMDRSDGETNYLVRVTVGDQSETFRGTIDGTDTVIEVVGFQYDG